ncbi:plastocyanin/azurin family copper-binding protein [Niveispirillum fermenti]|uniref:plastocyanin/azurin family copper-binding protein n=1 Tax=Niveispirillum fermenti TaxID=1233113 RepID=UPI003A835CB7
MVGRRNRVFALVPLVALGMLTGSGGAQAPMVIAQRDIAFAPRSVTIKVGDQVIFRNEDPFGHNVYSPSMNGVFDIGLQDPDTETPVTFTAPGEFIIQCRIHPKMRAKVLVEP